MNIRIQFLTLNNLNTDIRIKKNFCIINFDFTTCKNNKLFLINLILKTTIFNILLKNINTENRKKPSKIHIHNTKIKNKKNKIPK